MVWFISVGCGLKWVGTYQLAGVGVENFNLSSIMVIYILVLNAKPLLFCNFFVVICVTR